MFLFNKLLVITLTLFAFFACNSPIISINNPPSTPEIPPTPEIPSTPDAPATPINKKEAVPLGTPTVNLAVGDREVTLTWPKLEGATGYNIYQSTTKGFTPSESNKVSNNASSFDDSNKVSKVISGLMNGSTYYFKVIAVNDVGISEPSAEVKVNLSYLNDTGIMWTGNPVSGNKGSNLCDGTPQDCDEGRDAQAAKGNLAKTGAGRAGFDFTKIGASGKALEIQDKDWVDNGSEDNGTKWSCVQDNHTGLLWEVKTDDEGIHNKNNKYHLIGNSAANTTVIPANGEDSLIVGSNNSQFCGSNNWRVPTREELRSIVDYGSNEKPAIDTAYFPHTISSTEGVKKLGYYWSSSLRSNYKTNGWVISFDSGSDGLKLRDGRIYSDAAYDGYYLRLVSGPTLYDDSDRYKDNGDGTVTDTQTNLTWKVCSEGQKWSAPINCTDSADTPTLFSWQEALEQAQKVNESNDDKGYAGRTNWRVPNIKELASLVALNEFKPAIKGTVFPNTPQEGIYWSSSPYASHKVSSSWLVNFELGVNVDSSNNSNRNDKLYLRLVSSSPILNE